MREFDLLRHIFKSNDRLGSEVIAPPGDDLAAVSLWSGSRLLTGVDQIVEGRHFDPTRASWRAVGRKAVARSLSDIAAMAASPLASLTTAVLPRDFDENNALELIEGMRACAEEYECPLVGGDISFGSGPVVCTVTVLAEPGSTRTLITRGGAKAGDDVYVSGHLGGAWKTDHHLTFEPRIKLALILAEEFDLHAMIDLSDGLGRDLNHIAEQSELSAEIEAEALPLNEDCDWRQAISDGEDYELCFTIAPHVELPERPLGVPIRRVGRLVDPSETDGGPRTTVITPEGERLDAGSMGWEHGSN